MRIFHTSDWHLGATLGSHERLPEQRRFLAWLLDAAVEAGAEALVVAGDIYDTVNPPIEAQQALAAFLAEWRRRLPTAAVVVVAGNHDSAPRIEAPRPYADFVGHLHLVGAAHPENLEKCLVALPDAHGQAAAWCLAVPFLRPADLDCRLREGETPEGAYLRAVGELYATLRDLARKRDPALPLVALGHCTVAGSERAGSERLLIGGVESVPASLLAEGVDYVALGHIHKPWKVGGEFVRYCGSPYALDIDERRYTHQVLQVDLGAPGAPPVVTALPVPAEVAVPMLVFPERPGSWDEAQAALRAFDALPWKNIPRDFWPLAEIVVSGTLPDPAFRADAEMLCAALPLRVVRVRWNGVAAAGGNSAPVALSLAGRDAPEAVFRRFYASQRGSDDIPAALLRCFQEAQSLAEGQA